MPQSVISRQLANPFLVPDFSAAGQRRSSPRRLATWELLGPLFRSFEYGGESSCMNLPEPTALPVPGDLELMPHQAQVVAAARDGHRTFLLADEPGLGKTAQALLAAEAANAYPLLVVVPNVVKTNWAREAAIWTPKHPATVIHGDGHTIDGFADIVVVNYEVLDRHVGWLGDFGFRGMVVDEAHFIKNKSSSARGTRSSSERIRARTVRPLLMALTGTPLINDIEDFRAIWQFLGWIDDKKPLGELMDALEDTGLTPADFGFYPPPATPWSTSASCVAARSTWPRTSPPAGSPTFPSSSTTRSAVRSGRRSESSPAGWWSATRPRSNGGRPARSSTASTTSSYAGSRPGSARTPPRRRRTRTCSA